MNPSGWMQARSAMIVTMTVPAGKFWKHRRRREMDYLKLVDALIAADRFTGAASCRKRVEGSPPDVTIIISPAQAQIIQQAADDLTRALDELKKG